MDKAERLRLLQQRLAKLQLGRAAAAPPVPSADGMPPIRIELAIKTISDSEQRVVDRVSPSPS